MEAKSWTELEGSVPGDEGVLPCWQRTAREEVTTHMQNSTHSGVVHAHSYRYSPMYGCIHKYVAIVHVLHIHTYMYTHLVHDSCCPKKVQHSILTAEQH